MPTGLLLLVIAGALLSLAFVGYAVFLMARERRQGRAAPAAEVARLLRDPQTAGLVVEMEGRRYRRVDEIHDLAASRRLATATGELLAWLGAVAPFPGPDPAPLPNPVPGQDRAPAPARGSALPPRVEAPTAAPDPDSLLHAPPPGTRSLEQVRVLRERARQPAPAAPASIVEQVDAVLQEQLAGSELAGRDIRLLGRPDGAVLVAVGGQVFEGIEGAPDPEVRAAIRRAVQMWEARRAQG